MSRLLAILLFSVLICGCKKPVSDSSRLPEIDPIRLTKHQYAEPYLGTVVHIIFYSSDKEYADYLAKECFQRVEELNAKLSDYLADSEVSKLSDMPTGIAHKVSDELFSILVYAQELSNKTDGAFDVTMGKHSKRWRGAGKELPETVDSSASYRDLILDSENKTITLMKPLVLDLGAIGKGYIADQLMLVLKEYGIAQAVVIIGGETVLADPPPGKAGWTIGVENPEKQVIGKMILANTCVSTSGDSYQFFEIDGKREAHIIDPLTKKGKKDRLNVTTIAPSAMQADAWATALRVISTEQALQLANEQPELEALFIPFQKEAMPTTGFPKLEPVH